MPNYSIGDVQGCFAELQALITKIAFDPTRDHLWFVGDLVNRGPKSLEVLRSVKSLGSRAVVVLGNHDLHLLAVASGQAQLSPTDTFTDVLNAPDCAELCDWLRNQPMLHHDPHLGYAMVHAGLPPQWDLPKALQCAHEVEQVLRSAHYAEFFSHLYGNEPACWDEQLTGWERLRLITNYLTRLRFCDAQGCMELSAKGKSHETSSAYMPWFKVPNRDHKHQKIIFGHWAALEGQVDEPNVYALDTGCAWGNCLTALCLEDQRRITVPCAQYSATAAKTAG